MIKKEYYEDEIPKLPIGLQRFIKVEKIPVVPRPAEVAVETKVSKATSVTTRA